VVAVGHVGISPDRVYVAGRALGVGQVLLADEDEGAVRHAAAVGVPLGGDHLLQGAGRVDGAGAAAALGSPRHAALDCEVDLEGGRSVLVAMVGGGDPTGRAGGDG